MTPPPAIVMSGIRKTFGPKVAVDGFDLRIPEGALYGFIGPNGAGKTTTIRMIMAIIFPDHGSLEVLGHASAFDSRDKIGYLPEERGLYRKMRVGAFLQYMARLKGMTGPEVDRTVRKWLDRVDLSDCYKKRCEELSKGMQQKVQFIAAVIHDPRLIILDEPFSGLDPINARLMRELIEDEHRRGKTIIFSTHVMSHAESLCDFIVMIDRGRKVLDSSLVEIRRRWDPRTIIFEVLPEDGETSRAGNISPLALHLDGVESMTQRDGVWEARLRDGADPRKLMGELFAAMPMARIELHRPTLEEVFVEIVAGRSPANERADLRESLRSSVKPEAEVSA